MSHDLETKMPVLPPLQRKRKAAPRYVWKASDYVRGDWTADDLIDMLEQRARGYNGILRNILCTAASILRAPTRSRVEQDEAPAPKASKRNLQPGRLSGSEREALQRFAALAAEDAAPEKVVLAEGRAMLAKVRERALKAGGYEIEPMTDAEIEADDEMRNFVDMPRDGS